MAGGACRSILARVTESPPRSKASASASASPEAPLVLASRSPRRSRLLTEAGIAFEAMPVDLDETPLAAERPEDTVHRLACAKARAGANRVAAGRWVLGSDTGVILGETLYGKPADPEDAVRLLQELLGHTHRVTTAVALAQPGGERLWTCAVSSQVTLREASLDEIRRYVATGESLDKAGAYALQGEGRRFVTSVVGSATNVIGLPVEETRALLAQAQRESATP